MNKNKIGGVTPLQRLRNGISQYAGILVTLVVIVVVATIIKPVFLNGNNIVSMIVNSTTIGLAALGMTFVILTGGIDLSAGTMAALTGVFAADLIQRGLPMAVVIPLGILVGAVVGTGIGLLIAKTNIPPFIITLGLTNIFSGLAIAYNDGYPIPIALDNEFSVLGNGKIMGVPTPIIVLILAFIICFIILNKTNIGRNVFAIGGNKEASRLSGISVTKTTMFSYAIHFALVAVAGMILASRLYSGLPSAGKNLEMNAITAVVLGGTSMSGGDGNIIGTVIGVLLLQVLLNVMTMFSFPASIQSLVQGVIVIVAVLYDYLRKKKA
ncbi:MAG: ABC transporter permease [Christensenellaceae bacterium]|nr:ABC transporter permease [Christensenellaceae bacterium]